MTLSTVSLNPLNLQLVAALSANDQLINLWLHGKSKNTQKMYRWVAGLLLSAVEGKLLNCVTLADLQNFADTLGSTRSFVLFTPHLPLCGQVPVNFWTSHRVAASQYGRGFTPIRITSAY